METQNLTDEELNALVAESLGWRISEVPSDWIKGLMLKWHYEPGSSVRRVSPPPEYAASLDACATFEATLDGSERVRYADIVCDLTTSSPYDDLFACLTATPRQRCIAFLRMKGVL